MVDQNHQEIVQKCSETSDQTPVGNHPHWNEKSVQDLPALDYVHHIFSILRDNLEVLPPNEALIPFHKGYQNPVEFLWIRNSQK